MMEQSNKLITKQLKFKANEFLNSRKYANNLVDILQNFESCLENGTSVTNSRILILEQLFGELLKRRDMVIQIEPLKPKDTSPETQYREWLQDRYKETHRLFLQSLNHEKEVETLQGLVSSMKLFILESKYPLDNNPNEINVNRFRNIIVKLLSTDKVNTHLFQRFSEYTHFHDILSYLWKILPSLTPKGGLSSDNSIFIRNFLDLINVSAPSTLSASVDALNCCIYNSNDECITEDRSPPAKTTNWKYDYQGIRKSLNKTWGCIMLWKFDDEQIHRQMLVVLLEKILPHLDKPLLLTDFLMESLDVGGPISLLALQGIFILIQHHNLTYPDIYEKLYSMFEPEIFHTKFKARLFYLADIFLTSSHLPENLVAAFVKRLARLSLVAPPQDIVIILYFIGNLILRHPGLKRLICHPSGESIIPRDPYMMDERRPTESNALESSLWEIASLQHHVIPSVSIAAKFISNPLPNHEWDLSKVLELNEDDIFDQEMMKKFNNYPINFDNINMMFLQKDDKVKQYWKLF